MGIRVAQLAVLLSFLAVGCTRHATGPGGGERPIVASSTPCESTSDGCDSGEVCDFYVPKASKPGSCLFTCRSNSDCQTTQAQNQLVCNPISGACEAPCNTKADCARSTQFSGSQCTSGRFCVAPASSNCANENFARAQGFCKFQCTSNADCSARSDQICNPMTGTCERTCSISSENDCDILGTLNPQNAGTTGGPAVVAYDCSPVTNTCTASCKTGSDTCGSNQTCYLPGAPATPTGLSGGTCEFTCGGAQTCSIAPFTRCSENVCKKNCVKDNDCNANQRCNLLFGTCETPCTVRGDCASNYLACSPLTGVCTASCTYGVSSCGSFGTNLECYVPGGIPQTNAAGTCEVKCATGLQACTIAPYTQCATGFCQKNCATDSDCADRPQRRCNAFSHVCEPACETSLQCFSSSLACSPVTKTCVAGCKFLEQTCTNVYGSAYQCFTAGVSPTTQNPNPFGTCEVSCSSSETCKNYPPFKKCGGGICQKECATDVDCLSTQRCNIFTGVCQTKCESGQCSGGNACSPITNTCTTSCKTGSDTCSIGQTCYAPGNPPANTSGTCELSCNTSGQNTCSIYPGYTQCFDKTCQPSCTSDANCTTAPYTRCDAIFKICEKPCSVPGDCTTGLPPGFACSPFTGTCVPTCGVPASNQACPDSLRNTCDVGLGPYNSCEIPCNPPTGSNASCSPIGNVALNCAIDQTGISGKVNLCAIACGGSNPPCPAYLNCRGSPSVCTF